MRIKLYIAVFFTASILLTSTAVYAADINTENIDGLSSISFASDIGTEDNKEQSGTLHQEVDADGNKYMVKDDGSHYTGWYNMEPFGCLYFNPENNGAAVTGVYTIDEDGNSNTYLFDSNGVVQKASGTPLVGEHKYWIKEDGTLGVGWLYLGNWKMYFNTYTHAAYTANDGLVDIDGHKYLFDSNGVMQTYAGTTVINGAKYWFAEEGYLRSGWLTIGEWKLYFDTETYQCATGMTRIDGKNYLFDNNGVLLTSGTPVIDGKKYYIGTDNTLCTGWLYLGKWKMYFSPDTYAAYTASDGPVDIDGHKYLFDSNGVMQTYAGTTVINGAKYWFSKEGYLQCGWLTLGNWNMYFDPETYQAAVGVKTVEGKKLIFDVNGVQITGQGTFICNGNKYYIDNNGNAVTGWVTLGSWKMYFNPTTGAAATGVTGIDGKKYIFDRNGVNINGNGLFTVNGKKYYIVDGSAVTGWATIGNWTMYFNPSTGEAATGLKTIDGKTYYFNSDGVRTSGREYINGVTYYFNADGTLIRNQWVTFNGEKIYVNGNGIGLTDRSDKYPGPYYIKVDRANCVITVYAKDSAGNYTIPVRAMTCSVGLPGTPTSAGTYSVGTKYTLKELMGPSWGKYATAVAGQAGVYFHSVATSSASNPTYTVPVGEYNKLGSPASHGCIRLCVRDAKWIYDYCAYGTKIYIGDNLPMPLGKPATVFISTSVDPTDPAA